MPVPVLLGLPWLFAALGSMFVVFVSFLAQFLTKKLLMVGIAVGAAVVLTVSLVLAFEGFFTAIAHAAPAELTQAVGLVIPSNSVACITAIASAHITLWAYGWSIKVLDWKVS